MSRLTICSVLTILSLSAGTCFAADPPKSESALKQKDQAARICSSVEVQPVAGLSDDEAEEVSFAAGRTLKHIGQARDALREGKKEEAARHVDQGLKLIAIIESVLPHYKVKTAIKSGNLQYEDEEEVAPRYVTLFDELERRDILSPVKQAKQEAAGKGARKGEKSGEGNEAAGALVVSHVDVNYSAAKLDIPLARHMLAHAKRDLQGGKTDAADEALLAVQSRGVLLEYEEIDLPLEEAADNLKLAEIEMKEGRQAEAKAALHMAIDDLKRYEKLVGENRGAEVKALHA